MDVKSELKEIESIFNQYLETCTKFYENVFIIKMNTCLSDFPSYIVENYKWMRNGGKEKPALYLQKFNRIIQFHAKSNKYRVKKPRNLDVYFN